jgi:dephospho-CoA kinase
MEEHKGPFLVGVTGGIATGKSTVAKMLEELGAPVIDYDVLSRKVVEPGRPALQDIVDDFGKDILKPDGTLDRDQLRKVVFQDESKRKKLERFIHPRLGALFQEEVHRITQKDQNAIIQVVVPLLLETRMQDRFDCLLMVYTPESVQLERLMKRDRNSKELALQIIGAQMPVEEKKKLCDLVVDNSGALDHTREQVKAVWLRLKDMQKTGFKNKERIKERIKA